jgi:hypothetical protein
MPEDLVSVFQSQIEAWNAQLEVLRQDPRVREFTELRRKIDDADAFLVEASAAPPMPTRSFPFDPYDAFEFGRDLTGKEVSTLELSKLAFGRFPDMSSESRRLMVHYLIDNGVAEVARKTTSGRPTWYRFGSLGDRRMGGKRKRLGIPDNEISMLKTEDLEDLATRIPSAGLIPLRGRA